MLNIIFPLTSSVVALIFAVTVLDQFFARRKPHQLIWAIGLFMYFLSTGCEFWTETWGLNEVVYRLWYLFGAILVAAYLGMGTLYLLARRRTAHIIMTVLLIASLYAAFRVFTVSLDLTTLDRLSGSAMPEEVRLMSRLSYIGAAVLIGGAIYSAWVFWRRKIMPHRVLSNTLIAIGALMPAVGGGLIRLGGSLQLFYLLELLGIIIILVGFLRNREVFGFYRVPFIHGFKRVPVD